MHLSSGDEMLRMNLTLLPIVLFTSLKKAQQPLVLLLMFYRLVP